LGWDQSLLTLEGMSLRKPVRKWSNLNFNCGLFIHRGKDWRETNMSDCQDKGLRASWWVWDCWVPYCHPCTKYTIIGHFWLPGLFFFFIWSKLTKIHLSQSGNETIDSCLIYKSKEENLKNPVPPLSSTARTWHAFLLMAVLGFELRALCLLGWHSSTSATPPALFALGYFWARISFFFPLEASLGLWPSYLCLPYSWDYRSELQYPAEVCFTLDWGKSKVNQGLSWCWEELFTCVNTGALLHLPIPLHSPT
jgi:hypothetical protein